MARSATVHLIDDHTDDSSAHAWFTDVRGSLAQLPGQERAVLDLVYVHGLSSRDIALHAGVPVSEVTRMLASGLRAMALLVTAPEEENDGARPPLARVVPSVA